MSTRLAVGNIMAEYLSPGVYVEEYESGSVPMEGVSTSTAGFIGVTEKGPVFGKPVFITGMSDYFRNFGGYLSESKYGKNRFLPNAIEQFFINGGSRAYVMRVAPTDAVASTGKTPKVLKFKAKSPGNWGNRIKVTIVSSSRQKTQILEANNNEIVVKNADGFVTGDIVVFTDGKSTAYNKITNVQQNTVTLEKPVSNMYVDSAIKPSKFMKSCEIDIIISFDDVKEEYAFLSLNPDSPNYVVSKISRSEILDVEACYDEPVKTQQPKVDPPKDKKDGKAEESATTTPVPADTTTSIEILEPFTAIGGYSTPIIVNLVGGNDGGLGSIADTDFIGTDLGPGNRTGLQAFKEVNGVSIMLVPGNTSPNVQLSLVAFCEGSKSAFALLDLPEERKKVDEIAEYRDMFDSSYAAIYHPWIETLDPISKKSAFMPPSGAIAGIYARTDNSIGVHKAPANEVVRACTGLEFNFNNAEQDILNPIGVNLVRAFPGRGVRVWGARTLSSNATWKYINVRRLFIFLEESIKANTNWVVFEPNSELLWSRVKRSVELFLISVWRTGALAGTSPQEAFFVDIGRSTMTQDDIDNGRLICMIGVAPVKPAEFVIFRIGQYTATSAD